MTACRVRSRAGVAIAGALVTLATSGCARSQHDGAAPGPREAPASGAAGPRASAASATASATAPADSAANAAEGPAWDVRDVDAGTRVRRRPCRIAFVGDSLTDETSIGGGYVKVVRRRCPESRVDNYGKGGAMVNQIRRRFEEEVLTQPAGTYDRLVVFGGVNDLYSDLTAGRTVDKISADLATIYAQAHARGMKVVAITVAPWGGFTKYFNAKRGAATVRLNDWIRSQRGAGAVDAVIDADRLLACSDSTRLCPAFELAHPDGLHFNRAGHERLGAALVENALSDCR